MTDCPSLSHLIVPRTRADNWVPNDPGSPTLRPWAYHCYGRCDTVWQLHPVGGNAVSAKRV